MITCKKTKTTVRTVEVQKTRTMRAVDMAGLAIPFDRDDPVAVAAVFHKSFVGNVLVALNKSNRPVAAWRDIDGIVPIKSKLIKSEHFESVLRRLKPNILYLNNGLGITSILNLQKLHVYDDQTLVQILDEIRNANLLNDRNAANNYKELSYQDMLQLDSTLTRREYNKLVRRSNSNISSSSSSNKLQCVK